MPTEQTAPGLVHPFGVGEEPLQHVVRIYLLFLQGLFNQFPTGEYRWLQDEKLSEIAITDQVPLPRERVEQRPAIVVMRGPAQFANLSLDQMRRVDSRTGLKERTDLLSMTVSMSCIAKVGPEAQRIAWAVMRHLRTFKDMIQRTGRLHKIGDELSMSPETPPGEMVPESDPSWAMVTVYSPVFIQWTETSVPLNAPSVQNITAHMTASLTDPATTSTQGRQDASLGLRPPTIRGVPILGESVPIDGLTLTVKT